MTAVPTATPPVRTYSYPYVQAYVTASTPFGLLAYTPGATPTTAGTLGSIAPRSYPYLNDEFFYSGYGGSDTNDTFQTTVGGYAADGWFKMFEFFEVPSQAIGAVGPVASGTNFDWLRQDMRPGQLNLNLIMDEEVFFSIAGRRASPSRTASIPNPRSIPWIRRPGRNTSNRRTSSSNSS